MSEVIILYGAMGHKKGAIQYQAAIEVQVLRKRFLMRMRLDTPAHPLLISCSWHDVCLMREPTNANAARRHEQDLGGVQGSCSAGQTRAMHSSQCCCQLRCVAPQLLLCRGMPQNLRGVCVSQNDASMHHAPEDEQVKWSLVMCQKCLCPGVN